LVNSLRKWKNGGIVHACKAITLFLQESIR
jgi:hypothetical protein